MPPRQKPAPRQTASLFPDAKSSRESLTEQQRAAIYTRDVSIALSAGAGCGKTYVLTRRFLSHLARGNAAAELSQLVAITFTERAAREMRDRIRKECRETLKNCPPNEVEHWLALVRQLDTARISTIHSFCGSLLRSHAVEAKLDPKFKLLDETTSGSLLRNAMADGLHTLLAARDADSLELVLEFGLDRTCSLLEQLTLERYRIEFDRWRDRSAEDVAAAWEEQWVSTARPLILRELAESDTVRNAVELLRDNVPDHAVMRDRRDVLLDELSGLVKSKDPAASLDRLRENARVQGGGGNGAWDSEEVYAKVQESLKELRDRIDKTREQWEYVADDLAPAARVGLQMLRVTERVGQTYDQRKREGAWLDFDDLLIGARDLLRQPEVRRRAAAGIQLLLVDEFQDTDPIQKEIVAWLCGEELLSGRLFVVGDVKQSIYRFRRAEPQVFRELRQQIPPSGRLPLTMNFRSQPTILNFVNALFDGSLGAEYEPLDPSCRQLSPEPCIEFLFSTADQDEADAETDQSAAAGRRREADWIARRLSQLLADGIPRVRVRDGASATDTLRPLALKDIVILFRAMTDVRFYEEALRNHGLDYYVVGGQAFFAQQEVFDLVNLCRTLDDPADEVALAGVLRSPFFSLSDDALLALGRQSGDDESASVRRQPLVETLRGEPPAWLSAAERERVAFTGRVLEELREQKDRVSLPKLLTLAVERTGYDAALLTEFLGERKLANLRKLIELARQFDQTGLFTLADFVDRLQEAVGEETKEPLAATHPESSNVIRLMSIHQSKGLEFPLVVVADMDRKGNDLPPQARFDGQLGPLVGLPEKFGEKRENLGMRLLRLREQAENLAETLRLLYVATTRAADHLILSANLKAPGRVSHPWLKLVRERFDLLTGQPRTVPTTDGTSILVKYADRLPQILVHHECPQQAGAAAQRDEQKIRLADLRTQLEAAEPSALPATLAPIAVDRAARRRFSVSTIREIDAGLQGREAVSLDKSDDAASRAETTSDDGAETAARSAGGDVARLLGDVVHLVLERVDLRHPADAAKLVAAACTSLGVDAEESDRNRDIHQLAVECVSDFFGSSVFQELADAANCLREIEFYLPWPDEASGSKGKDGAPPKIITGKLDCLVQSPDGDWSIIDYKTGRLPAGKSPAHALAEYEMQLAIYALAVQRLCGAWPARSQLVLLRHNAERIGFDPRTADWDKLTARIDAALRSAN